MVDRHTQEMIDRFAEEKEAPQAEKRSWVTITHARTKGIETQLTRIANCLEVLLEQAYGYTMTPLKGDTSGPEPRVRVVLKRLFEIRDRVPGAAQPVKRGTDVLIGLPQAGVQFDRLPEAFHRGFEILGLLEPDAGLEALERRVFSRNGRDGV